MTNHNYHSTAEHSCQEGRAFSLSSCNGKSRGGQGAMPPPNSWPSEEKLWAVAAVVMTFWRWQWWGHCLLPKPFLNGKGDTPSPYTALIYSRWRRLRRLYIRRSIWPQTQSMVPPLLVLLKTISWRNVIVILSVVYLKWVIIHFKSFIFYIGLLSHPYHNNVRYPRPPSWIWKGDRTVHQ